MRSGRRTEQGTAAVELALVLPILLMLVSGVIYLGMAYNAKIELTGAVREGARALALGESTTDASDAVINAAPSLGLSSSDVTTTACPSGGADGTATVTASYKLSYSILFVSTGTWTLQSTGVMRCGL